MKSIVLVLTIAVALGFPTLARAEMAVQDDKGMAAMSVNSMAAMGEKAEAAVDAPQDAKLLVGNKKCPVSGELVGKGGMEPATVEYKGEVYNLCCAGCKEPFLAEPEKFSKIAKDEVAAEKSGPVEALPQAAP